MNKSEFVWVLTNETTGEYDIYNSIDGAAFGVIELLRTTNNGKPVPGQWIWDFCGKRTEEDLFQHILEHTEDVDYFDMRLECRPVRD